MAFVSEFAAKICSSTFSPDAAALLALADAVEAEAAELEVAADEAAEPFPDEQPTRANAATKAAANAAATTTCIRFFMCFPSLEVSR
jgi:enoyl-CoA hydratase/carnithine racemase